MQGERDLGLKRRGGLLDWVTGRTRNTPESVPQERPMPTLDSEGGGRRRDGNPSAPADHDMAQDPDRHSRDQKDTDRTRNPDEPFEIPNFFKRPMN